MKKYIQCLILLGWCCGGFTKLPNVSEQAGMKNFEDLEKEKATRLFSSFP